MELKLKKNITRGYFNELKAYDDPHGTNPEQLIE